MYKHLREAVSRDGDYSERVHRLAWRERVRDGLLYDGLPNAFHQEKDGAGEYIELRHRRPNVRYNLCRAVIDDAVSLLFSEGHFPTVRCKDKETRDKIKLLIKERGLNQVMVDAATKGSVGSAAILMRVLSSKLFFEAKASKFLTPEFKAADPDQLVRVVEEYKTTRAALLALGITPPNKDDDKFWWRCEWTVNEEVHFIPQSPKDHSDKKPPQRDDARSVKHGLGFVPMVWIRNLPGGEDAHDGLCTFSDEVVDTQIELEYQLSQVGRGLKYSSDPTLLIKEPAVGENGEMVKGGGNAIAVDKDGDAKLLEINGTAADVVMKYAKILREYALEALKGRSADPAKLSAARSAKAMEMLNQPLIWLADRLRVPYGEGALLALLRMVVKASEKLELKINDDEKLGKLAAEKLSLHWPPWYSPTPDEKQTNSITIKTLIESKVMSRETATEVIAPDYDIEDLDQEQTRIAVDVKMEKELNLPKLTKQTVFRDKETGLASHATEES